MKYCRFLFEDQVHYGAVEDRSGEPWIVDLTRAPEEDLSFRLEHGRATLQDRLRGPQLSRARQGTGQRSSRRALLFFKPPSSLLAPGGIIRMPAASARVDYEGELALVIGRRVRNLKPEDWRSAIRGYTLANDVTARDLQAKDGQWTRAKGFDTSCPAGPWVSDEVDPEAGLTLETRVNNEVRQHGSTLDFIFSIPALLAYITAVLTLEPGDLVLTGTPAGVGPLSAGDRVEVSIPGLGVLANTVEPDAD
jgi:2-keto-4-pentenoate hydratase/2-oxohepta-3-ene-1,7-dioic acid hydratase in catechol pathway